MNRSEWRQLAEDRILDAEALLAAQRWSGAYYLAGYALECGLKSCVLAYLPTDAGVIFRDRKFSEKCWSHNLENLLEYAELEKELEKDSAADPTLGFNWSIVKKWTEISRYRNTNHIDAQKPLVAIQDQASGILPWVKRHW
jgi:hypothetical protein